MITVPELPLPNYDTYTDPVVVYYVDAYGVTSAYIDESATFNAYFRQDGTSILLQITTDQITDGLYRYVGDTWVQALTNNVYRQPVNGNLDENITSTVPVVYNGSTVYYPRYDATLSDSTVLGTIYVAPEPEVTALVGEADQVSLLSTLGSTMGETLVLLAPVLAIAAGINLFLKWLENRKHKHAYHLAGITTLPTKGIEPRTKDVWGRDVNTANYYQGSVVENMSVKHGDYRLNEIESISNAPATDSGLKRLRELKASGVDSGQIDFVISDYEDRLDGIDERPQDVS